MTTLIVVVAVLYFAAVAGIGAWATRRTRTVIMQRLHDEDLTGHLLKRGGFEHLCLP